MQAPDYWQLFLDTGAPEAYLAYSRALRMEAGNVSDDPGRCPESIGLQ